MLFRAVFNFIKVMGRAKQKEYERKRSAASCSDQIKAVGEPAEQEC